MLAANTRSPQAKPATLAEKAKDKAPPLKDSAFNPTWAQLAFRIQPKLTVSAPDDPYEREADKVAEQVMRMAEPSVQRRCAVCGQEQDLQRKESSGTPDPTATLPPVVHQALSTPGQPLDPAAREFFEARLGHDFSSVRVHADRQASQAAQGVAAQAFTVGRDIVFGSGHYAPDTERGRHLLAHELTHVAQQGGALSTSDATTVEGLAHAIGALQRRPGNRVIARLLDTDEGSPALSGPDPVAAPALGAAPRGARSYTGAPVIGQPEGTPDEGPYLPPVAGQPVPGIGENPLPPTRPVIGRPVGTPDEYPPVAPQLPPTGRPYEWVPIDPVARNAAEWKTLAPIHSYFDTPTPEYYGTVRSALMAAFGADRDGTAVALQRILTYYRDQIVRATFQGFRIPVHRDLAAALSLAEKVMAQSYPLDSVGGLNIRFNTNNPSVLSDHSYGSAVDINGTTSPNVKDIGLGSRRAELIEAITGVDPSRDVEGRPMTTDPRTFDEMLEEADRLSVASEQLSAAFADEESLVATAYRIAGDRGDPTGGPEQLSPLMFAAAGEEGRWRWEPYPTPAPAKPRTDANRQALATFVFPTDTGESSRIWDESLVTSTVDLLALMARIFRETFTPTRKDPNRRVSPTARSPSDAQLALHGFLSVPPEMVAALSGSDAGNLRWLAMMGGRAGTKDYMHFELRQRPDLY